MSKLSQKKGPSRADSDFPIVAIGASAGGLEAVTTLFKALPEKPGMAVVVLSHLDPTHESALAELLARAVTIPVSEAKNNEQLEVDHVYVIPPGKLMGLEDGRLKLTPRSSRKKEMNSPIDYFFKSLAVEARHNAYGVILSGSGGMDGVQGCLTIKDEGGVTFAQDQHSAKYPGMPAAAVAAGCVDYVLPPERIARELRRLVADSRRAGAPRESRRPVEENAFEEILALLRRSAGVDFSHYKPATLGRRVHRRMVMQKCQTLQEYATFLRKHSGEVRELFNDILIQVTSFFRDPAVFNTLKRKVFPKLTKGRSPKETIRIWVPGCATGEEVYSLAMALSEFMTAGRLHLPVQIFGTDINETALEKARAGMYPARIEGEVSATRLRRFFKKSDGGWRIDKSLREMCIFSRQNVASDPPFSNLDLVSCRNLLIYLGQALQRKVMPLLHYSLRPTGYLLLGTSETIGSHAELFSLVDRNAKLYVKKASEHRPSVVFSVPAEPRIPLRAMEGVGEAPASVLEVQKAADRLLLAHHSPPGVVINNNMEVVQFRGKTGDYLQHPQGEATLNLLKLVREGLMIRVREAVSRAMRQNGRVREENVPVRREAGIHAVTIEVMPLQASQSKETYYLVVFEPARAKTTPAEAKLEKAQGKQLENAELRRLKEELEGTRENLQAIIEEQEATNEELRSANEEVMSSNEELQSTNEELETAKEELQSTNEELATLNDELESRNVELERLNDDLQNLLTSVDIPLVIVGPDLKIRRFTAVAEKLLNLIPTDVGRPLTDLNLHLPVPHLGKLVGEVMETLQAKHEEVRDPQGHWWSLRIRPYKTSHRKIDGAVLALVDIDAMRSAISVMEEKKQFAESIVDTVREPLVVLEWNLKVRMANESFYRLFQVKREETVGRKIYDLGNRQWDIPELRKLLEEILPQRTTFRDFVVEHTFEHIGHKRMVLNARQLGNMGAEQAQILLAIEDLPG